jgi:hypothetical protein
MIQGFFSEMSPLLVVLVREMVSEPVQRWGQTCLLQSVPTRDSQCSSVTQAASWLLHKQRQIQTADMNNEARPCQSHSTNIAQTSITLAVWDNCKAPDKCCLADILLAQLDQVTLVFVYAFEGWVDLKNSSAQKEWEVTAVRLSIPCNPQS